MVVFLMNTAVEFAGRDHAVSTLVSRATLKFADIFQVAIQKIASALAVYLISSVAGLRTMIKANADPESIHEIIPVVVSALD